MICLQPCCFFPMHYQLDLWVFQEVNLPKAKLASGYIRLQQPTSSVSASSTLSGDVTLSNLPAESRICRDLMVEKFNRVCIVCQLPVEY
jgi:hypothetical protein